MVITGMVCRRVENSGWSYQGNRYVQVYICLFAQVYKDETTGLLYQLRLCQGYLLRLCAGWQKPLESLDARPDPLKPWGPSEDELMAAWVDAVLASVAWIDDGEADENIDDGLELYGEGGEINDTGLAEALELLDMTDGFRDHSNEM